MFGFSRDEWTTEVFDVIFAVVAKHALGPRDVAMLATGSTLLLSSLSNELKAHRDHAADNAAEDLLRAKARGGSLENHTWDFKKSMLTDADLRVLCSSSRVCTAMEHVVDMCFNVNQVGDEGISSLACIATMLPFSCLTSFYAMDNDIGDAGIVALADAASQGGMPNLRKLTLYCNCIGDLGVAALSTAITRGGFFSGGLESLLLMDNRISDLGLEALVEPMRLGKLRRLQEFGIGDLVTDTGLNIFTNQSIEGAMPELEELYLMNNQIREVGALLEAIKAGAMVRLRHLGIENTPTTKKIKRAALSLLEDRQPAQPDLNEE